MVQNLTHTTYQMHKLDIKILKLSFVWEEVSDGEARGATPFSFFSKNNLKNSKLVRFRHYNY